MNEQIMWYYQDYDQRAGPVEQMQLIELINKGVVSKNTLVWREGMSDWEEACLAGLGEYFEDAPAAAQDDSGVKGYLCSQNDLPKKLRLWFMIFGISLCVSIFLAALGPISWVAAIASSFFGLLIMYHVWSMIPDEKRPFSPFVMVSLMIIPLCNLVWIFICYYSAAKKINTELEKRGGESFRVNETLALGYCVIAVLMTVMFVFSYLTGMVFPAFTLLLVFAIITAQIMLLRYFIIAVVKLLR